MSCSLPSIPYGQTFSFCCPIACIYLLFLVCSAVLLIMCMLIHPFPLSDPDFAFHLLVSFLPAVVLFLPQHEYRFQLASVVGTL